MCAGILNTAHSWKLYTGRDGRIDRAQASHAGGREFGLQSRQSNEIKSTLVAS